MICKLANRVAVAATVVAADLVVAGILIGFVVAAGTFRVARNLSRSRRSR